MTATAEPAVGAAYVYGVIRSGALRAVEAEGVRGAPVELVEAGGVTALVSTLPAEELRVTRRDLRRHLDVIEEAFAATTILPCRFGTLVDEPESLCEELLEPRREAFLAGLEVLDGRAQMNVKAAYDEDELLAEVVVSEPEVAALRERTRELGDAGYHERLRLGELVAAAVAGRREADAWRIVQTLAAEAVDTVAEPADGMEIKASFLVERRRLDRFDAALEQLAAGEGSRLRFDAIGPLPPTAFASAVVEA